MDALWSLISFPEDVLGVDAAVAFWGGGYDCAERSAFDRVGTRFLSREARCANSCLNTSLSQSSNRSLICGVAAACRRLLDYSEST